MFYNFENTRIFLIIHFQRQNLLSYDNIHEDNEDPQPDQSILRIEKRKELLS